MIKIAQKIIALIGCMCLLMLGRAVNAQEKKMAMQDGMKMEHMEMTASTIPQKAEDISPLLTGEKIPMAMLANQNGKMLDLNKLVAEKPTILIFYRGGWCPYCSKQLAGLEEIAADLNKIGYQLLAVSTDKPDGLMESAQKENLKYTLLSDADVSVAKKFGIAFKAPKGYWDLLPKSSGGKNTELLLPVPSVFILDRKGKINFEYINPDITQRLKPQLLKVVAETIINDL
ncbi:peroxiredoxin-like family protein [Sphingobacterium sp.]|uniref:peroxiredoxin-like family protein n=1 Tax=Sphingobacterium sp. TaxID=341027 RepID=UPI0028A595EC|nr:peroxiredoxin-like family protein [Sphingobacterium sp.]